MKYILFLAILILALPLWSNIQAQNYSQTIYGTVIHKANFTAVPQASIEIVNTTPKLGTTLTTSGETQDLMVITHSHLLQEKSLHFQAKIINQQDL